MQDMNHLSWKEMMEDDGHGCTMGKVTVDGGSVVEDKLLFSAEGKKNSSSTI